MSEIESYHYLVAEDSTNQSSRKIVGQITNFFASKTDKKIIILTKKHVSKDDIDMFLGKLSKDRKDQTFFIICNSYSDLLSKLQELDASHSIAKVVIIESLHQWYDSDTSISKLPHIYSAIMAALQDLVNVNSKILKEKTLSFITTDIEEFPKPIMDLYYSTCIKPTDLLEILEEHK